MSAIPDLAEYITAWRSWQPSRTVIQSLNGAVVWPTKSPMKARCGYAEGQLMSREEAEQFARNYMEQHGRIPSERCSCGIYAKNAPPPWIDVPSHGPSYVTGRVALWGRVVKGEKGYRAEFAYPLSLSDRELAAKYGCEYEGKPSRLRQRIMVRWRPSLTTTTTAASSPATQRQ